MFDVFRLIPAMQVIFTTEIEFDESSFAELNEQQYAAFERDHGKPTERMFQIVLMEPTAIERTEEKVTLELNVVSESQKQLLFEGVAFVYRASANIKESSPSFIDRLSYLRPRLPPIVIGKE